jgi:hypothetical protein
MLKLIHKYVRRLVLWVQMPSVEEIEARQEWQRANRRKYIRGHALGALRSGLVPDSWRGLRHLELERLLSDICVIAEENSVDFDRVRELTKALKAAA